MGKKLTEESLSGLHVALLMYFKMSYPTRLDLQLFGFSYSTGIDTGLVRRGADELLSSGHLVLVDGCGQCGPVDFNKILVTQEPEFSLVDIWNQYCGGLPKVRLPVSDSRKRKERARLKECSNRLVWIEVVIRLGSSYFCTGHNERGWLATYDFLLKPETRERTLEGKYDGGMVEANLSRM